VLHLVSYLIKAVETSTGRVPVFIFLVSRDCRQRQEEAQIVVLFPVFTQRLQLRQTGYYLIKGKLVILQNTKATRINLEISIRLTE